MTEHESAQRPASGHAPRLRRHRPDVPSGGHGQAPGADPLVSRVAACALGLAYAQREDADGLRELVDIAEEDETVLAAARGRLAGADVVDAATRRRADALLYTAIGHLDRLVS